MSEPKAYPMSDSDDFIGKAVGSTYYDLLKIAKGKLPDAQQESVGPWVSSEMLVSMISNLDRMVGRDMTDEILEKAKVDARDLDFGPGLRVHIDRQ